MGYNIIYCIYITGAPPKPLPVLTIFSQSPQPPLCTYNVPQSSQTLPVLTMFSQSSQIPLRP